MGMGAFYRRAAVGTQDSDDCWLELARETILAGYPIIALMWSTDRLTGPHYRLMVGLDGDNIITLDPWDRGLTKHMISYTAEDFCLLWNNTETCCVLLPLEFTLVVWWALSTDHSLVLPLPLGK